MTSDFLRKYCNDWKREHRLGAQHRRLPAPKPPLRRALASARAPCRPCRRSLGPIRMARVERCSPHKKQLVGLGQTFCSEISHKLDCFGPDSREVQVNRSPHSVVPHYARDRRARADHASARAPSHRAPSQRAGKWDPAGRRHSAGRGLSVASEPRPAAAAASLLWT